MSQRVGVCVDSMGSFHETPDDERDKILKDLRDDGLDPELVFYGHDPLAIPFEQHIDALVVDYGIIAAQGGGDDWTRHLLRWADEHPGSLLLIWSSMTADGFVYELRDALEREGGRVDDGREWTPPWPANVRAMHPGGDFLAKWGDGDSIDWLRASTDYVRGWFGIEGSTPLERAIEAAGPLVPPSDDPEPPEADVWPDEVVSLEEVQPEPPAETSPKKAYRPCSRCLREGTGLYLSGDHYRCVPCGLYQAHCTCETIELPPHPMVDGLPLLIGERVRVKGREPEPGGPIADGVVTKIRFVLPHNEVWIEVGDGGEVFTQEDVERWTVAS